MWPSDWWTEDVWPSDTWPHDTAAPPDGGVAAGTRWCVALTVRTKATATVTMWAKPTATLTVRGCTD